VRLIPARGGYPDFREIARHNKNPAEAGCL